MTSSAVLPRFSVGDVVREVNARYRGVVVGYDERCQASDEWFEKYPSGRDRDQPWYHVLMHGTTQSAYVAEDDLLADVCGEQIVHPLVRNFFDRFQSGRYHFREE